VKKTKGDRRDIELRQGLKGLGGPGQVPLHADVPDAQRLLQELQVHQIELELQNEELVRSRSQLESVLARFTDLYDFAPVGYFTLSKQGSVRELNLAAAKLVGLERSRVVGNALGLMLAPASRPHFDTFLRRLAEGVLGETCEVTLTREGSAPTVAELKGTLAKSGDECRIVAVDVTAHRHAQRALQASERRYRALYQGSSDAMLTLAPPTWRFTSANASTLAMLGAADERSLLSHTLSDCSPERQPPDRPSTSAAAEAIGRAMAEGAYAFDWTLKRANGETFPATILLSRIEIDDGVVLQATLRDETEKRAMQAHMAQADRLTSMGLIAAGVAHEINNPLTYVLQNIEGLAIELPRIQNALGLWRSALEGFTGKPVPGELGGPDGESLRPEEVAGLTERAHEALEGSRRIRDISKNLATFARVDPVEKTWVDINVTIGSAIDIASNEIKYRANLVRELGPVKPVWGSEGKLAQVFLNLLINAARSFDEGLSDQKRISVRTWTDGSDTCAEVVNSGKAIPPANLRNVFEPFFASEGLGRSAGMGLSIARNLVVEMGGQIMVESAEGKGTRFMIRLPGKTPDRPATPTPPRPASPTGSLGGRLLVVDDEPTLQSLVKRILGPYYELMAASSATEARAILEKDPAFDLILCDLMMPGMSGMDLHAWLTEARPELAKKIVFVTGGAFTPKAADYLAAAGNPRIDKPFNAVELKARVAELLLASHS
jgi:PAS domain S-box-containing protein